jgi:DNA-binding transcriptional LysR family regulator
MQKLLLAAKSLRMHAMNLHDEDLNLLVVFEALMETRSVSKASERLNLSQPSMSNALARMRKAFDDPMFVRVKNTMEPTANALRIAASVQQVLSTARSGIYQRQTFNPETSTQIFTLCMTDIAEAAYLPRLINAVHSAGEGIRLRTLSPILEKLEEGLESGTVDLAIGYFPDTKDANVIQQSLLRNTGFVCVARAGNPFLVEGALSREGFEQATHAAIRTEGRSHEVIEVALDSIGVSRRVVVTMPHFLGLLSIVPNTDLIGVIPSDLASIFERQPGVCIHPLPFSSPTVRVVQAWHRRYDQDAANRWLRNIVREVLFDAGS